MFKIVSCKHSLYLTKCNCFKHFNQNTLSAYFTTKHFEIWSSVWCDGSHEGKSYDDIRCNMSFSIPLSNLYFLLCDFRHFWQSFVYYVSFWCQTLFYWLNVALAWKMQLQSSSYTLFNNYCSPNSPLQNKYCAALGHKSHSAQTWAFTNNASIVEP